MKEREGSPVHPWVADGEEVARFAIGSAFLYDWSEIAAFAQRAERLGFDGYWANDHPNRMMECWVTLMGLAMVTERLRLISLVSCVYYRHPYVLARQAADVDRVSDGRLVLGVGIGWDAPEFRQMNIPMPPLRERQEALEDTLEIVRGLWTGGPFTYEGRRFSVFDGTLRPLPVQDPWIPVLIAGGGERVTLRQVAHYGDMSNFAPHETSGSAFDIDDVSRKLAALRGHCGREGRPYSAILRSHSTPLLTLAEDEASLAVKRANARIPDPHLRTRPLFATPDEAVAHYASLHEAGIRYFLVVIDGRDDETVRLFAEAVVPAVRALAQGTRPGGPSSVQDHDRNNTNDVSPGQQRRN